MLNSSNSICVIISCLRNSANKTVWETLAYNNTGNVRITNVTLRRVRASTVTVEKQ